MEGKLKVYELEIVDNTKMLVISAEPADEESDPDIYVGVNDPLVDQDNYVWKSTNIGADKLEIHPEDESFIPGLYHIAILGYKPDINTFVLSVKA